MANTLTNIMDKILARALPVLRETARMPQLVNRDYEREAKEKGDTIDVPLPTAIGTRAVTPAETPPALVGLTPSKVQITLDNWQQNDPFGLTDKEMGEIDANRDFLPPAVGEAVRGLANDVNADIMAEYLGVYGYVGTAGTTPFGSDVTAATLARKALNDQLCPRNMRRYVMDSSAEANALALSQFADLEKTGDSNVKMEGEIGRKYGFDMFTDDGVVTHTAGTAAVDTDTIAIDEPGGGAAIAAGVTSITIDVSAGTSTFVIGDIFTIAGDLQTYVCTAAGTLDATGVAVAFQPPLKIATTDDAVVTFKASHVVNLAFHRDAFAFASRPLLDNTIVSKADVRQIRDNVTGLTLRLEVSRRHKETAWEFDILWGAKLVRPELATRIAG